MVGWGVPKKGLTECCWHHGAEAQLPVAGTPCAFLTKTYFLIKTYGWMPSHKTDQFSKKERKGKGGGVNFQSKSLYCRFWTFKQGFLSMIFKKKIAILFSENEGGFKGRLERFQKFFRVGDDIRP